MSNSLDYYNQNAASFFSSTVGVDMSPLWVRFLALVPDGGHILDAGCGSGRDTYFFTRRGYQVSAFDASPELAKLATAHTGIDVQVRTFASISESGRYDGIWACASLLHVARSNMVDALERCWNALKPGGVFYMSFKLGSRDRHENGRDFTDATEDDVRDWCSTLPELCDIQCWITADQRPGRAEPWLNVLAMRAPRPDKRLVTGGQADPFLPHLCASLNKAAEVDLAVAFVKATGLRLLLPDLHGALAVTSERPNGQAKVRFLTSDYLDVTDPEALRLLMLLQEQGAQVKVYESAGSSFHLKAYIFSGIDGGAPKGVAFIGSSNISRQALQNGLEWNLRSDHPETGYLEAKANFDALFSDPRSIPLTDAWIEQYERRRVPLATAVAPGSNEIEPPPDPTPIQRRALEALAATREHGYRRGVAVLATGLGKTWLAAFDVAHIGARRVLFVAHREEILNQAAETFLRIRPGMRVGFYMGKTRDVEVDILCASVQTLGRNAHLERFAPQHFDYIVIDEFHHAAAATYRRVLNYFAPRFLLGLTATPDRTDQSDILSLCDDNLVYTCGLFEGVQSKLLVPFHYYGIYDAEVDYAEIPWRNGKFDPDQLSSKLATFARARHALKEWRQHKQTRTLAFCVSKAHADFMAGQFQVAGVNCAAVYSGSTLSRADALERLHDGRLEVVFSVDLFNEGMDLPTLDTVMMLRPTESKILFLQQLGRGLRRSDAKERLVVLDFIGNHTSFLHKPQALFSTGATYKDLASFARKAQAGKLELPEGCFVNFDLQLLDFLKSLDSDGIPNEYDGLKQCLGRRPTAVEFYRSGASVQMMRQQYGSWFQLVAAMDDLNEQEAVAAQSHSAFLKEVEVTAMTRSYKMILLEALLELNGLITAPTVKALCERSWEVYQRRPGLQHELSEEMRGLPNGSATTWQRYWQDNPVNAWVGGNRKSGSGYFQVVNDLFRPKFEVAEELKVAFESMVKELVDLRLAQYDARLANTATILPFVPKAPAMSGIQVPYFSSLKIACGHFRESSAAVAEHRTLGSSYGHLDPARHFIARASGNSMDGGKAPIKDGDYLLLEHISPTNAGSLTGTTVAIERDSGDGTEYLLRTVQKTADGYMLHAQNSSYDDMPASGDMRTLARLKAVIGPLEMAVGQSFMREEIPPLFGEVFSPAVWQVGHVALNTKKAHVLLVTLNKQGKVAEHRYVDHWIDESTFYWQSQNSTTPESAKGLQLIEHESKGIAIHLFVREHKLANGKASPFVYFGQVRYGEHSSSAPMSFTWTLK
jgi:superfamily II DNA or RNA helicase/HKD family nuclease/SOS-response transcriptional repressor LexA